MSDIPKGWAVIPKATWYVAVAVALGVLLLMLSVVSAQGGLPSGTPAWFWTLTIVVMPLIAAGLVVMYGWIYGDAKRRGMRAVLWVLLGIFIPNLIGVILYFVMRDPLPTSCPKCSAMVAHTFAYCPSCGTQMVAGCAKCGKAVEPGWQNCAHCGGKL